MNLKSYTRTMSLARLGLSALCLALLLTGCGSKPCPPARPTQPPAVLLQDVPEPKFRGKTNADLVAWSLELRQALRLANKDKAELRKLSNGMF